MSVEQDKVHEQFKAKCYLLMQELLATGLPQEGLVVIGVDGFGTAAAVMCVAADVPRANFLHTMGLVYDEVQKTHKR